MAIVVLGLTFAVGACGSSDSGDVERLERRVEKLQKRVSSLERGVLEATETFVGEIEDLNSSIGFIGYGTTVEERIDELQGEINDLWTELGY